MSALYIARQAATVGRRARRLPRDRWLPCLAGGGGDCLGVLQGGGGQVQKGQAPSLALHPDGRTLATGSPDGRVRLWNLEIGAILWEGSEHHANKVNAVAVSPDGQRLASASYDNTLRVWSTENGRCLARSRHPRSMFFQIQWSADSRRLAAASADEAVRVWNAALDKGLLRLRGHQEMVWSVAWSADERYLASGSADQTIRIWDSGTGNCLRQLRGHRDWVVTVAWSPDGRRLASLGNDHTLRLWDSATWQPLATWEVHPEAGHLKDLIWSPDGCFLASAARDHAICIWDSGSGALRRQYAFPEDCAWRLAWSPDGTFLASSHSGDVFRLWNTRPLTAARSAVPAAPLSAELAELPGALAQLHRLGLYPPLSLVRDLLRLTGGQPLDSPLAALAVHPGLRALAGLRWPGPARVGLSALLLRNLDSADWQPPPGLAPLPLRQHLAQALADEPMAPQAPAAPLTALRRNADDIDERLVNLLTLLGPEAVAAEPGLPLRLLLRLPELPRLSADQRRLLALRLPLSAGGRTQGGGTGGERAGVVLSGDLRSLLPSQLVLPEPVLHSRDLRGELLYRARSGNDPPRLRPMVLVLDVSPPCFGAVEAVTRPAAHLLARALRQARLPAVLVGAGGAGRVHTLEQPADLLEIWTLRSLEPVRVRHTLRLARALAESLRNGADLPPIILVLSHAWFGAEQPPAPIAGLRALLVHYPGLPVRPVLAEGCERWESIPAGEPAKLAALLGRLLG